MVLAEAQLATDPVMHVLGRGLGHLRCEAMNPEHVVVGTIDLQAVGQLGRARTWFTNLSAMRSPTVGSILGRADVVAVAKPMLLGLAGEREPPELGVDVRRVVHDHRVAVGECRPVSVDGLELQPAVAHRLLHRALQARLELTVEEVLPFGGIANTAELPAHLVERVAIDERVHVPDGNVAQHPRPPERDGGDRRIPPDRALRGYYRGAGGRGVAALELLVLAHSMHARLLEDAHQQRVVPLRIEQLVNGLQSFERVLAVEHAGLVRTSSSR